MFILELWNTQVILNCKPDLAIELNFSSPRVFVPKKLRNCVLHLDNQLHIIIDLTKLCVYCYLSTSKTLYINLQKTSLV